MSTDHNREAFRLLRNASALVGMELLWRWSFGLGLISLVAIAYARIRPVMLLAGGEALNMQDPGAFAESATNMIVPVLPLLAKTFAQVFSVAAVLWTAISALGRGVITRAIVGRLAREHSLKVAPDAPRWASFAALQCARVLMLLILVIGYLGGVYLGGLTGGQSVLAAALVIFIALVSAGVLWSYVNWVLSLAPIFVARDALSPLDATVEAVAFIRRRSQLRPIAIWNSSVRGGVAMAITLVGAFTAALPGLPPWALTVLLALETLAYLVISDVFLLARLTAYASVAVSELSAAPELAAAVDRSGTVAS